VRAVLPAAVGAGGGIPAGIPILGAWPQPAPGPGEVLIRVLAAGLNQADLMQLAGRYPPPAGESPIPGLECAGLVEAVGGLAEQSAGASFAPGERVMALLAGGGLAEFVCAPAAQVLPAPPNLTFAQGAAVPEALVTAWTNLVAEGGLLAGETVLVTGATGGMGTMAVALAAALGAKVVAAARDARRLESLYGLGAAAVALLDDGLADRVRGLTPGGADLVVDFVGGEHFPRALAALGAHGRYVLVGLMAGRAAALDLDAVLRRRLRIAGSLLRPRPRPEKGRLVQEAGAFALPLLADGSLRPVVDRTFPFAAIVEAYAALAGGGAAGKIVVTMA
jgi:NADPH:quinone reductase